MCSVHTAHPMVHHMGVAAQVCSLQSSKNTVSPKYYMAHILPVGLPMALSMQFGNTAYLFLSISLIEMLKVRGFFSNPFLQITDSDVLRKLLYYRPS